ncbi:septum formation initiator family protein [Streptomyces sp. NPDC102406]|uniref:septum formation initiator family protein n=1 Tax=Streptomyces sp. NPDC102406 TaxID=3366171 RepID=UPI003811BE9D
MTARSGPKDARDAQGSKAAKGPKGATGPQRATGPRGGSGGGPRGRAARFARIFPVTPSGGAQAARAPFVLLVVLLLGGGLIMLLLLNSSLNEGSFRLSKLRKQTTELTDDEQQLQRDVDSYAAPDALQRRARELGMVEGGDPAFLSPNGTVRGKPSPAALFAPLYQPVLPPETVPALTSAPQQPGSATPTALAPSNPGR